MDIKEISASTFRSVANNGVLDEQMGRKNLSGTKLSDHYDFTEPIYDKKGKVIVNDTHDDKLDPLPAIAWACYGDEWHNYEDNYVAMWERLLHSPFQRHVKYYSGAISRMDMEQRPATITGTFGIQDQDDAPQEKTLAEGFGAFGDPTAERFRSRFSSAQKRMRSSAQIIRNYSVAKPFGQVKVNGELKPPFVTTIVLPVFDHTAIIPAALENPGRNPLADWEWYMFRLKYLPVLGTVSSLDEMPHGLIIRFSGYHELLKRLNDPEWRKKGIEWLETPKKNQDSNNAEDIPPQTNEDDCQVNCSDGEWKPRSLH